MGASYLSEEGTHTAISKENDNTSMVQDLTQNLLWIGNMGGKGNRDNDEHNYRRTVYFNNMSMLFILLPLSKQSMHHDGNKEEEQRSMHHAGDEEETYWQMHHAWKQDEEEGR